MSSDASVDPATEAAVASESSRGVLRDLLTPAIRFALLLPLLLIALVVVLVAAWWAVSVYQARDHRAEVAQALLQATDGGLDEQLVHDSVAARFPDGIPVESLEHWTSQLRGRCNENDVQPDVSCGLPHQRSCDTFPPGKVRCEIPVAGGACSRRNLVLIAELGPDLRIAHLITSRSGGCTSDW